MKVYKRLSQGLHMRRERSVGCSDSLALMWFPPAAAVRSILPAEPSGAETAAGRPVLGRTPYPAALGAGRGGVMEDSKRFFLEAKNDTRAPCRVAQGERATAETKVFCFFSSEKKVLPAGDAG